MDYPQGIHIEDLRDKYKGAEIWILGTGPSMDDYPQDFFDDKISLGMKWAGMIFPNCTYSIAYPHKQISRFLLAHPEAIKKHIYLMHRGRNEWLGKYINDPIYMNSTKFGKLRTKERKLEGKERFFETIRYIKQGERPPHRYPTIETVFHWSIQAAVILGAQKIICTGCEEKGTKKSLYAQRFQAFYQGKAVKLPPNVKIWHEPIPKGGFSSQQIEAPWNSDHDKWNRLATRWLAQALAEYEVEIFLYHLKDSKQYKAGYLKVI